MTNLTLLRRPAISPGAGAAHQHCPLSLAQAASLKEGLDRLLVVHDCERACPIRAPQPAIETPGIEHAGKRVPNVREGVRFPGQRAGAADLDHRVRAPGEFQHLREVGPGLRRASQRMPSIGSRSTSRQGHAARHRPQARLRPRRRSECRAASWCLSAKRARRSPAGGLCRQPHR